jgi:hypothetical protein
MHGGRALSGLLPSHRAAGAAGGVAGPDERRCLESGAAIVLPKAGVPQVSTIEGKFVRASYNNEGYVILGYQASNRSVGEEWMLLEVGITLREGVSDYRLTREAISLDTPDGKTLPLPSITEQRSGGVQAIQQRAKVQRDSINYFPPKASRACALLFFPDLGARSLPFDEVDLSDDRACVGRFYFKIPGGIALRPALAQREVPEQPRAGAVSNPDRGRRALRLEELQEHRAAGQRGVQLEVADDSTVALHSPRSSFDHWRLRV